MSHLTDKTLRLRVNDSSASASVTPGTHPTRVSVRQEVITQQWSVGQCLDNAVHEARVAKVDQASQTYTHTYMAFICPSVPFLLLLLQLQNTAVTIHESRLSEVHQ